MLNSVYFSYGRPPSHFRNTWRWLCLFMQYWACTIRFYGCVYGLHIFATFHNIWCVHKGNLRFVVRWLGWRPLMWLQHWHMRLNLAAARLPRSQGLRRYHVLLRHSKGPIILIVCVCVGTKLAETVQSPLTGVSVWNKQFEEVQIHLYTKLIYL